MGDPDPNAELIATFTISKSQLRANFDASGVSSSAHPAESILVRWDYTNDGAFDTDWAVTKTSSYTYPEEGTYTARLEIKDPHGQTDSATKLFTITRLNNLPTAAFNVVVNGMTVSVDASSSSDSEDSAEDLLVRWDWGVDDSQEASWQSTKTCEYTYASAGEYTIELAVKDLNGSTNVAKQTIIASPITIRNAFLTYRAPYMVKLHFRMINNLTGQPVTPDSVPPLTRDDFLILEDQLPIDVAETGPILNGGKRPMFLAMVLDFTGSMYDAGGTGPMMEAAKLLIESQDSNTYINLWAFYERQGGHEELSSGLCSEYTGFTPCTEEGKLALVSALDAFAMADRDRGATEIWDVLKKIVDTKYPSHDTGVNRVVLFLSDGHDTASTTTVWSLIDAARKKAVSLFSLGLAFRPLEYPADEPKLREVAEDTGGVYFTINQVADLERVFTELSEDIKADWSLSYITLRNSGFHKVESLCSYLDGYAKMWGTFNATTGDIRAGLLGVVESLDMPSAATEYTLYAHYIPRNIREFRIGISSTGPVSLTLYDDDTLCNPAQGWRISPDVAAGESVPADGWYTISSDSPLDYGAWGRIARCTVETPGQPVRFELEQGQSYGDKQIVFEATQQTEGNDGRYIDFSGGTPSECSTLTP